MKYLDLKNCTDEVRTKCEVLIIGFWRDVIKTAIAYEKSSTYEFLDTECKRVNKENAKYYRETYEIVYGEPFSYACKRLLGEWESYKGIYKDELDTYGELLREYANDQQ